jgi:beta-lysine 5,6-aminomutase alpha subunit
VADKGEPGSVPLLQAISDGTFGLMKRPPDAGKGLDGVVRCAPGYDNPASTLLATPLTATTPTEKGAAT